CSAWTRSGGSPRRPPRTSKARPSPPTGRRTWAAGWRDQLHAALVGLGYAPREADEAVASVAPRAEAVTAEGGTPQVGQLLRAALQRLNRAR
ncbi:RuvA C-terminal domain-containing protein, partial [Streptomyces klenkii]